VRAEAALGAPRSYFEEVHDEYAARRNCIIEALNKIEGVYTPMPKGSFYSIVKLPIDSSENHAKYSRGITAIFHEASTPVKTMIDESSSMATDMPSTPTE